MLLAALLLCFIVQGQLPGMKVYTQLDGYPGTVGYVIYQDFRGFIWIGTDNGVACFDGKKFKVLDDRDGLRDKEIISAIPYSNDYVLLSPLLNNYSFYHNGRIIPGSYDLLSKYIHNKKINNNHLDYSTGIVWLSEDDNNRQFLNRLSADSIEKISVPSPSPFLVIKASNDRVFLSLSKANSRHWVDYGIYDYHTRKLTYLKRVEEINDFTSGYSMVSDDGKFIVSYSIPKNKALVYEVLGDTAIKLINSFSPKKNLKTIVIDKNNHLWITFTGEGVEYHGHLKGKMKPFVCLENMVINNVFADRDNNIWFTTEQKGLCFISDKHWANALLNFKLNIPSYMPWCITGNEKSIYIGNYGNSFFTTLSKGSATTQKISDGFYLGLKKILIHGGNTLCLGRNMELYTMPIPNTADKKSMHKYILNGTIKDLIYWGKDTLLAATHNSVDLVVFDKKDPLNNEGSIVFLGRSTSITALPDRSILIGTPSGLYYQKMLFGSPALSTDSILKMANITDLEYAVNNYTLVGTSAQGLYCFNNITQKIKPVKVSGGNRIGIIRHLYKQNDSVYWLSTDGGAIQTTLDKNMNETAYTKYTFLEGLPSNNVWDVFIQHDTAYVATAAGLGILPILQKTNEFTTPPQVWISEASFDDSVCYFPKNLVLTYKQNDIQFSLSAISYESVGNTHYRYRINGLSEKWVETESPEISFSGLSPGQYVLEVYAINFKGMRSLKPASISITIKPAFWQTAWFKWMVGIVLAGLLYFIIHSWVLREKNKQYRAIQQKKRLAELELEAIKAQMNPHFVYNCLNSIQYFSYKSDYEQVKKYLDFFAKLIRQTMQYSQETFITLDEETNYLTNYLNLEKIRFKEKLDYELVVDEGLLSTQQLPAMMVQPYVENALKHGVAKLSKGGMVRIHFSKTADGRLKITIEDNGPGLKEQTAQGERKHLGLRLSGSRASTYNKLFNLDIQVNIKAKKADDPTIQGTIVELIIPHITYENRKV